MMAAQSNATLGEVSNMVPHRYSRFLDIVWTLVGETDIPDSQVIEGTTLLEGGSAKPGQRLAHEETIWVTDSGDTLCIRGIFADGASVDVSKVSAALDVRNRAESRWAESHA